MSIKVTPHHLLIATANAGKVNEIQAYLHDLLYTIVSLSQCESIRQVAETGSTFEANALLKAQGYAKQTGYLTLADDSGLEVDALEGRPGVYSARYGDSDAERNRKLLRELEGVEFSKRTARFRCVMALLDPKTKVAQTVEGVVEGLIALKPDGNTGFGYDPVFYYPPLHATFAQMGKAKKNTVSHRGQAMEKISGLLRARIGLWNK